MSGALKPTVYVASPLGFSEAGRHYYSGVLLPRLRQLGLDLLDPWTLTDEKPVEEANALPFGPEQRNRWQTLNRQIAKTNFEAIDSSQAVVAVLDGTDVDSGTACEVGYAYAKGKKLYGYRGDFRLSADNIGSIVNLQVEYCFGNQGGIAPTLDALCHNLRQRLLA